MPPGRELGALRERLCASGEERPQGQHEHLIKTWRRTGRGALAAITLLDARCGEVPARHNRLQRVTVAPKRQDQLVLGSIQRLVAQQDVGRLAEREPEIRPIKRHIAEAHGGASSRLLGGEPLRVGLNPWQRDPRLNPALHVDEGELHVDRRGELRVVDAELFELSHVAGVGTRRARGTLGHERIVSSVDTILSSMASASPGDGDRRARSVLIIGSEALPFAKTGGLADVLGALPRALARLGWQVSVALPRYRGVTAGVAIERFSLLLGGQPTEVGLFDEPLGDGARALLIDVPELYDRDGLYGAGAADYPDNALRFGGLVRAALEFVARTGVRPSVVHAHDWQAGLAPVYLKTLYEGHPVLGGTPSVFTIHNLAYQGVFAADWLPFLDLPASLLSSDRLEYWGGISFLKGGINDADLITTVSPTYAEEIQTPEFGFGFDGIVRRRAVDLIGILNGIDAEKWDPERDEFLPAPYSASDLSNKRAAKAAVLERYQLPVDERTMTRPLIGMISRMVEQKGLDLIAASAGKIPRLEATFVVLGTGDPRYEALWRGLAAAYPDRIGARIGFDEALAHLIEGGADMFLMPSRFEPCGLNQMYSLRYGTVPIVRAVGGLADTVEDGATGFVFAEYTAEALLQVLRRALAAFQNPRKWRALQLAGMKQDHSWDRSAREYVRIYERAIQEAGA
jgi:starch synthase